MADPDRRRRDRGERPDHRVHWRSAAALQHQHRAVPHRAGSGATARSAIRGQDPRRRRSTASGPRGSSSGNPPRLTSARIPISPPPSPTSTARRATGSRLMTWSGTSTSRVERWSVASRRRSAARPGDEIRRVRLDAVNTRSSARTSRWRTSPHSADSPAFHPSATASGWRRGCRRRLIAKGPLGRRDAVAAQERVAGDVNCFVAS